jgi:uncharacterized protein YndB with AHSA1/START domain
MMESYGKRVDAHTVRFERLLPGPVEKIWAYLTDGQKRGEWFASGPLPAKVGETFQLRIKHSDLSPHKAPPPEQFKEIDAKGYTATEQLLALEPMRRLAYTFGYENPPASEVEFTLRPEGEMVRLILTHSKVPDRAYAVNVSGGWHSHLSILQYKAEGKVPPAFWDVWRETEHTYEQRYT